jgi:hypothetical protein
VATAAAESDVKHALPTASATTGGSTAAAGVEKKVVAGVEGAAARESPGYWSTLAGDVVKGVKGITPAKAVKFGKNLAIEGAKGLATAVAVDYIIGDSRLEDDLAALDAANHAPHDSTPEKIRHYEKEVIGLLPPQIAIPVAGAIRTMNLFSADFLYEATVQANQRRYAKWKEDYGDSEDAARAYDSMEKLQDDWANGITPWDQ